MDGYGDEADRVMEVVCKKLVLDMHYEAQVQCVIDHSVIKLGRKMYKPEARTVKLTREEYLQVKLVYSRFEYIV